MIEEDLKPGMLLRTSPGAFVKTYERRIAVIGTMEFWDACVFLGHVRYSPYDWPKMVYVLTRFGPGFIALEKLLELK